MGAVHSALGLWSVTREPAMVPGSADVVSSRKGRAGLGEYHIVAVETILHVQVRFGKAAMIHQSRCGQDQQRFLQRP